MAGLSNIDQYRIARSAIESSPPLSPKSKANFAKLVQLGRPESEGGLSKEDLLTLRRETQTEMIRRSKGSQDPVRLQIGALAAQGIIPYGMGAFMNIETGELTQLTKQQSKALEAAKSQGRTGSGYSATAKEIVQRIK